MKTLVTILFLLVSVCCFSQNFEGTIKWSMKSEITDPKMKAQMEEAQKKMNDPETQKQMKEMQAKMNSPEMKAMMDKNPQMKQQMEASMKMMQGGDMSSMFPKGFTLKVKNGNALTMMEGGTMGDFETLFLKDKDQAYMINKASKTYSVIPPSSNNKSQSQVTVKKTTETQKILNYNCTKTIVTITDKGTTITQNLWITTEIKGLDLKSLAKQRGESSYSMFYENMEGVALKMEMTTPQAKMVSEVTEIKKEALASSIFAIPAGFTETKLPGQH